MPEAPTHLLHRFLRAARAAPTDRELLRRYATARDEDAFAELVRRHGPMVLGAATRVLGRDPAAEDAFQVAFSALARRAATVRGESVAGWLHRTVVRAAGRLRPRIATAGPDLEMAPGPATDPCAEAAWREVRQVLDRELDSLPARLRVPLVLCYLEALTRDEAAARLGWSLRTLERRLGQARAVLHDRLQSRGVAAIGLAAVATAGGLTVPVSSVLAESTVRAAPPAAVASVRLGIGLAAAVVVATGVTVGLLARSPAGGGQPPKSPEPTPVAKEQPTADAPDVPLPPGAVRRFGSLAWRHNTGITEAVLSADGKTLVTVGQGTLAVWDVATGRRTYYSRELDLLNLIEPGNAAVAPDGSWFAYPARVGAAVRVIDLATGKERLAFSMSEPAPGLAKNQVHWRGVWATPDGKSILFCRDKTLTAYDAATGKRLRTFDLPGHVVALSPDGKQIIVHDHTNPMNAWVYDAETGKEVVKLDGEFKTPGADAWAIRAVFGADGKRTATISHFNPEVRLWDSATGKLVGTFKRTKATDRGDDDRLVAPALSHDGKTLYAGGFVMSGVRRWDVATGKELLPWLGPRSSVSAVLATRDTVFAFENDGMIRRWDPATGKPMSAPRGHADRAMAARSPDGRVVVTADLSGHLLVWDAATGQLAHTVNFTGEQYGVPFAFSQDGKTFACALQPGGIRLYDPATWKPANEIKLSAHMDDYVRAIAFLPGGTTLILHHGRDQVERRDIGAEKPTWTIKEDMLALAVAPDGKRVAVSNAKGVSIRSAADGSEERLIPVTPDAESRVAYQVRADALAFSPDGSLLAMTRWDEGDVFVWDVATGSEYRRLVGHPVPDHTRIGETTVTFSADGRWLATGHADRTTRVWEVATGKEALRLIGHDATVSGASFSRDGRTLLTTGGVEVLLWDLRSGSTATTNLDTLWADLASDDAGKAYKAAATLSARDNVPEFLRGKLPPVAAVDPERVAKLVAELDSGRFAVREAAKKALADLGGAAQKALEAGLKKGPSAEGRARIEELLTRLVKPLAGTEAREARAVQALQWSGTAAARAVLKEWAAGAAGARLTEEAKRGVGVME